jgi:Lysozyme like domain
MANFSYAQLEGLWINAGGNSALAPVAAAIAMAESGGNPGAENKVDNNGTQTSWGLWQISDGTHNEPVPNILDPSVNAREAVAKYNAAGGWSPWGTYGGGSGTFTQFLQYGIPPDTNVSTPSGGGTNSPPGQGVNVTASNSGGSLDFTDALSEMQSLFHGAAEGLSWLFWLWEPGQGWRLVMGVTGVVSGVWAMKLYTSPSIQREKSSAFPAAILLTGVSLIAFYMTLRAWPVSKSGGAERPGPYAVEIITGQNPPAGPPGKNDVPAIQGGLEAITAVWVVNKAAGSIGNIAGAAGVIGGIWAGIKAALGSLGKGGGGGELPPIPDVSLTIPNQGQQGQGGGTVTV